MSIKNERDTTPNYGLIKPKQTDFYNVDDFNENMSKIDGQIKVNADGVVENSNQIKDLYNSKLDKMEFHRGINIDDFYTEGSHRIFNATGLLPKGIQTGENDIILTCYPISDGTLFVRKTILDVRSNNLYLYSKKSDTIIEWEEVATLNDVMTRTKSISLELINNANYSEPYTGTMTGDVAEQIGLNNEYHNIIYMPNVDNNGYGTQILQRLRTGELVVRGSVGSKWQKFKEIAITERTELSVPFNAGYENEASFGWNSRIIRNDMKEVMLVLNVKKSDNTNFEIKDHFICKLPTGFFNRNSHLSFAAFAASPGTQCRVYIANNGDVHIDNVVNPFKYLEICVTYMAED